MICSDCPLSFFLERWLECSAANKKHKKDHRDQVNPRPQTMSRNQEWLIPHQSASREVKVMVSAGLFYPLLLLLWSLGRLQQTSSGIPCLCVLEFHGPFHHPRPWAPPVSNWCHLLNPPGNQDNTAVPFLQMGHRGTARLLHKFLILFNCDLAFDYELLLTLTSSCL